MKNQKNIWVGQKDLTRDEQYLKESEKEFVSLEEHIADDQVMENLGSNRRDFLKLMGFGMGAATMAASCDIPVKRAIPYVVKPDEIVPGVATYYASSYVKGGDFCSILVKTREGRPIKIEGNDLCHMTQGGTTARAQASVLELYDTNRFKEPQSSADNKWADTTWAQLDKAVSSALASGSVRVITNTVLSPTAKKVMAQFAAKYPSTKVVSYDPVSSAALLEANEKNFGQRVVPDYHFDKAKYIVSFNADFLGTWVSPAEYSRQFVAGRKVNAKNPNMSRLVQVENHMSLTGTNADNRILVKPSEQGVAIAHLYNKVVGAGASTTGLNAKAKKALDKVAKDLFSAGSSLVVGSSNNVNEQLMLNAINNRLGNYGKTISFGQASLQRQGDERELGLLVAEMASGSVGTVIVYNANPAYDYVQAEKFAAAFAKVRNRISLAYAPDETSALCNVIAPASHTLESWGDAEPKRGHISVIQPAISTIFNTRQPELSLLTWAGAAGSGDQPYYDYLKANWSAGSFTSALHDGVVNGAGGGAGGYSAVSIGAPSKAASSDLEISFVESVSLGNGQYAGNPWLQEMPDPVTRTSWGTYLAVPVKFDGVKRFIGMNGLNDGDLVELTIGSKTVTVPVIQQFGQMPGTVTLNLGGGRSEAGKAGTGVGVNVNDCLTLQEGRAQYYNTNVSLSSKKGMEKHYSAVQYHHTYGVKGTETETGETINADEAALGMAYGLSGYQGALTDRSVIYTANQKNLKEELATLHHKREEAEHLNSKTLYPYEEYVAERYSQGHHWGMHVDLNACTGCGACTVACMAENNVPIVGKKEVSKHHEMTWLRIDRYYYGDHTNPNVVYHPMMCQHCDNAPCENVCPVNATNHSAEGLNQMTYNRCVGTRYCANNCPFKVRRFNWLDYTTADIFPANQPRAFGEDIPFGADNLTRMVLNPDVTVRSRGVIEKCSFCVQRIQEGKLTAKKEGRRLVDKDVKTACQTSCPTGAITFGDQNNKKGELSKKLRSPLNYIALEEINVRSSVTYTMKVNNRDEALDA
jgi:molybdopterin-containing oxidoreductase family iron-sulfur binding subunit